MFGTSGDGDEVVGDVLAGVVDSFMEDVSLVIRRTSTSTLRAIWLVYPRYGSDGGKAHDVPNRFLESSLISANCDVFRFINLCPTTRVCNSYE